MPRRPRAPKASGCGGSGPGGKERRLTRLQRVNARRGGCTVLFIRSVCRPAAWHLFFLAGAGAYTDGMTYAGAFAQGY